MHNPDPRSDPYFRSFIKCTTRKACTPQNTPYKDLAGVVAVKQSKVSADFSKVDTPSPRDSPGHTNGLLTAPGPGVVQVAALHNDTYALSTSIHRKYALSRVPLTEAFI